MFSLVIELDDFSAAHRLIKGYQGKCNHLHGHNYRLKIMISGNEVEDDDLMIDFSVIRRICNTWVASHIDHCILICVEDRPLLEFAEEEKQKHFVVPYNTTVERLAQVIYKHLQELLAEECVRRHFTVAHVEVWESAECGVIYSGDKVHQQGNVCG